MQRLRAILIAGASLGSLLVLFGACSIGPIRQNLSPNKGWRLVSSPNPGLALNGLNAVTAISASDIWAVGTFSTNGSVEQTLVTHWNSTQWSVVPSPNPGSMSNVLNAVAAISANDAWAVGYSSNSGNGPNTLFTDTQTLIEHWNGTQWSTVPSPNVGSMVNILSGVAAVSPKDIWAVGYSFDTSTGNVEKQPLIEHWNGRQWSVAQNSSNPFSSLSGVTALSANNVWAVGTSSVEEDTLIEHWNGKQWSIVQSPNSYSTSNNVLAGVVVLSAGDVWAVGYAPRAYPLPGQALIEHWNGTQWSIVPGQNLGRTRNNYLVGVAQVPGSQEIWAVGYYGSGDPERTIAEVRG